MNRITIQLGTMAVACAFSSMAFAAGIEVKPRERANELAKPGAIETLVRQAPKGKELKSDSWTNSAPTKGVAPAPTADRCDIKLIADGQYNKIHTIAPDISASDVQANMDYLNQGNCGKSVSDLSAEPLANLHRITKIERDCLSGQLAAGNPKRTECLVEAHKKVLGLDQVGATDNVNQLDKSCHYSL
jgi:hypothetical protein